MLGTVRVSLGCEWRHGIRRA